VLREEIADILQEWEQNRDWIAARRRRRLIAAGGAMAAAALAIALLLGIHFYRAERQLRPADVERLREEQLVNLRTILKHPSAHPEFDIAVRPTNVPEPPPGADPPSKISGSDGMTLRFVPGGKAHVAVDQVETPDREQTEKTVRVAPFYMDETKITNHLYVEFLREVSGVRVQGNAVINDGQIWLLLGEIREGYEPIKYVDGEFRIQSDAVSRPVVRVTPLGALAYARHYGRTLPTMAQWWRAIQAGGTGSPPDEAESAPDSGMMHEHMMQDHMMRNGEANQPGPEETNGILPVTRTGGNRLGIRGLAQNVNEWVFGTPEEDVLTFHVHGGVGELESLSSYFERHPWEAFARVGFRTVIEAPAGEGGS
jgi:formylglycine-generating enzyme required for sulfatase activity